MLKHVDLLNNCYPEHFSTVSCVHGAVKLYDPTILRIIRYSCKKTNKDNIILCNQHGERFDIETRKQCVFSQTPAEVISIVHVYTHSFSLSVRESVSKNQRRFHHSVQSKRRMIWLWHKETMCIQSDAPGNNQHYMFVQAIRWWVQAICLIECAMAENLHDDAIKWKHFPRYWPFVRGIHRSPVNSPHKGQWRGALMFSLICVWINGWVNNREVGDLRRYHAHYDVTVMYPRRSEQNGRHLPTIFSKTMLKWTYS